MIGWSLVLLSLVLIKAYSLRPQHNDVDSPKVNPPLLHNPAYYDAKKDQVSPEL